MTGPADVSGLVEEANGVVHQLEDQGYHPYFRAHRDLIRRLADALTRQAALAAAVEGAQPLWSGEVAELKSALAVEREKVARLGKVLADHYLWQVVCDHEHKTDRSMCSCGEFQSAPQPNVGEAVQRWIEHVLAALTQPKAGRKDMSEAPTLNRLASSGEYSASEEAIFRSAANELTRLHALIDEAGRVLEREPGMVGGQGKLSHDQVIDWFEAEYQKVRIRSDMRPLMFSSAIKYLRAARTLHDKLSAGEGRG